MQSSANPAPAPNEMFELSPHRAFDIVKIALDPTRVESSKLYLRANDTDALKVAQLIQAAIKVILANSGTYLKQDAETNGNSSITTGPRMFQQKLNISAVENLSATEQSEIEKIAEQLVRQSTQKVMGDERARSLLKLWTHFRKDDDDKTQKALLATAAATERESIKALNLAEIHI